MAHIDTDRDLGSRAGPLRLVNLRILGVGRVQHSFRQFGHQPV